MYDLVKLGNLRQSLIGCTKCTLSEDGRSQIVFGCGNARSPDLMAIGEGPGAEEDRLGEPFCGPAGQLLNKMFAVIGYERHEVYFDNVVKCRPENNRKPTNAEAKVCVNHVKQQVHLVDPKVIVIVGATAAEHVLGIKAPMRVLRGTWHTVEEKYPACIIYHPAYILRLQGEELLQKKQETWEDLKRIRARVDQLKLLTA